jgi:putative MFS transporter
VGLGSALSRVGAAAGTFLLPLLLAGPGLRFAMFTTAVVTLVGLVVTVLWAPETHAATLWEASTGEAQAALSQTGVTAEGATTAS